MHGSDISVQATCHTPIQVAKAKTFSKRTDEAERMQILAVVDVGKLLLSLIVMLQGKHL